MRSRPCLVIVPLIGLALQLTAWTLPAHPAAPNGGSLETIQPDEPSVLSPPSCSSVDTDTSDRQSTNPWTWSLDAEFLANPRGREYEKLGSSVSIDGDTVLVGASHDDPWDNDPGEAHVFVQSGTGWIRQASLRPSDSSPGDWFGSSVVLLGDVAVIGAHGDAELGTAAGGAYIFERSGTLWEETAKLVAPDGESEDHFGVGVSMDGTTVVVGASGDDDSGSNAGAAHVFVRSGSTWVHEAKLIAQDGAEEEWFGFSVALDGDQVLIGAPYDDTWGEDWGSAYLFSRSGTTWSEIAKGTPVDGTYGALFGWSVALQGDTALIGAPFRLVTNESGGAAFVFHHDGSEWTQQATLSIPGANYDEFGWSVALEGDTALVGADGVWSRGKSFVYSRTGSTWNQQATLGGSAKAGDRFGASVDLDGATVLIGSPGDNFLGNPDAGSATVFEHTGTAWEEEAKLALVVENTEAAHDHLGLAVALFGDMALIGAPGANGAAPDSGIVRVYRKDGEDWTEEAFLVAADGDGFDHFGASLRWDGDTVVVGAYGDDDLGTNAGAAYVFAETGSGWEQQAKLVPADGELEDTFGCAVAVSGDTILVGAYRDDDQGLDCGAAYVFHRTGSVWQQEAKLLPPAGGPGIRFGIEVSLDLDTAVVGADRAGGGRVHVFQRAGTDWSHQARLSLDEPEEYDEFGTALALDHDMLAVGAPGDEARGAVHLFHRQGTTWTQGATIVPDDTSRIGSFGRRIDLDGARILIGGGGVAYVFGRQPSGWVEQALLRPGPWYGAETFGHDVSLWGTSVLVGAPGIDDFNMYQVGGAFLFKGTVIAQATFRNAGTNPASYFATTLPVLGTDFLAEVDLAGTTGHDLAVLAAYTSPLTFVLAGGQTGLVDVTGAELLGFPSATGPTAAISISIPDDVAYLGFELFTQAAHVGGIAPFALSNAQDLAIGY